MTAAEWVIDMSGIEGLALKLGIENEYDSQPRGDARRNDLNYYLALVYGF